MKEQTYTINEVFTSKRRDHARSSGGTNWKFFTDAIVTRPLKLSTCACTSAREEPAKKIDTNKCPPVTPQSTHTEKNRPTHDDSTSVAC